MGNLTPLAILAMTILHHIERNKSSQLQFTFKRRGIAKEENDIPLAKYLMAAADKTLISL